MTQYSCCKDCQERYPACHDYCERYQSIKRKNLEEHNKIMSKKIQEKRADAVKIAGYKRMAKKPTNSLFSKNHMK